MHEERPITALAPPGGRAMLGLSLLRLPQKCQSVQLARFFDSISVTSLAFPVLCSISVCLGR
jgi:hypothetical protein